jgi:uncharacterized protein
MTGKGGHPLCPFVEPKNDDKDANSLRPEQGLIAMADYSLVFLGVAAFAVFFVALAKAGFGGMIGSLAMPLVASVSDIPTAISVLLPTYVVMDLIVAWTYRKSVPFAFVWPMALSGIAGVFLAAVVYRLVETTYLAIFLGLMSMLIGIKFFVQRARNGQKVIPVPDPTVRNWPRIIGLNGASGFTSFFLMGEAPIQLFMLPFRLAPQVYVAVLVWFFAIINWTKIPIVLAMGIVTIDSLWVSLMLLPIMPLGIMFGKYINSRLPKEPFYLVVHVLLIILGIYLILNAIRQISGASLG